MVRATYGGPLIKPTTQEKLRLPPPLEHSDSFDSLIGILKALPETDNMGSPPRKPHQQTQYLPDVPAPSSFGRSAHGSSHMSDAFAPLTMSPNTLAAKVEALQRKLLGGSGGTGATSDGTQLSTFSFKLNSHHSPQKPLAEGRFSGVMPWKMFGDEPGAAVNPKPASPAKAGKHLLPDRPPLVRGGSFTVRFSILFFRSFFFAQLNRARNLCMLF